MKKTVRFRELLETDNAAVAALVRDNLKKYKLDIPGTAYFDEGLDRLRDQYGNDGCKYYVIEDDHGQVIGGIGFARFEPMEDTAESQHTLFIPMMNRTFFGPWAMADTRFELPSILMITPSSVIALALEIKKSAS